MATKFHSTDLIFLIFENKIKAYIEEMLSIWNFNIKVMQICKLLQVNKKALQWGSEGFYYGNSGKT